MSKIIKAVKKVFKKVTKVVKKIVKSKIFKVVLVAAAIYFGGAGLMSMANGGTFSAGVGSAAGSLSAAGSSLMNGQFITAGETLTSAWGTAGQVGASLKAGGTMASGFSAATASINSGGVTGFFAGGATPAAVTSPHPALTPPVGAPVGSVLPPNPAGGLTQGEGIYKAAKVAAGTAMAGQAIGAYGGYRQQKDEEEQLETARKRRTYYGMDQQGGYADLRTSIPGPRSMYDVGMLQRPQVTAPTPMTLDDLLA